MRKHSLPRRGAAVIEMAMVLPVFFLIVMGIIEFGRGFMVSQMLANAAREGARLAVVDGSTNDQVQDRVESLLAQTVGVGAEAVSVQISITPASSNPDPADQVGASNTGDQISVQVSVPYNQVGLVPGNFLGGRLLEAHVVMRRE